MISCSLLCVRSEGEREGGGSKGEGGGVSIYLQVRNIVARHCLEQAHE